MDIQSTIFQVQFEQRQSRNEILSKLNELIKIHDITVQLFNPTLIISEKYIQSAIWHGYHSYMGGKPLSRDLGMEILLFLSGQRQITKALTRVGIPKEFLLIGVIVIINEKNQNLHNLFKNVESFFLEHLGNIRPFEDKKELENIREIQKCFQISDNSTLNFDLLEKHLLAKIPLLRVNNY